MAEGAAFLIVDVQVDFCPGGSLAVPGGDTIIPVINRYIELFRKKGIPVFASRDWHPVVTSHFVQYGGLWPPHCVQGSEGARFHPLLRLPADVTVVSKGMDPDKDDYSAFHAVTEQGEPLPEKLRELGIARLYLCGLATDYCVRASALEGVKQGLAVTVLKDAVKGVNLKPGDSSRALKEIVKAGGELADLAEIEEKFRA
ncbi:MAG: bifunctional nicotinamidase/pyrazinamidase [Geobacteraceae bacterium]|nr:bifunctional nicotinamidase/pyrazinamidase [Geobacteraceae bacterium]